MNNVQARKKRYKLNVKLREGTISPEERVQLAQLDAFRGKPGKPRKRPAPKPAPVETPATAPTESKGPDIPVPPPDPVPGAAPGIAFSMPGVTIEPEPPKVETKVTAPSPMAHSAAQKVVTGLATLATFIEQAWGFPPLMGMDAVVYPALTLAWASVLDDTGLAGKLDDLANNKTAARVAVVTSAAYLGGGGLYAMIELRKRAKAAAAPESPPVEAKPEPAPAVEDSPATNPYKAPDEPPPPPPIDMGPRRAAPIIGENGLVQIPRSYSAESKD